MTIFIGVTRIGLLLFLAFCLFCATPVAPWGWNPFNTHQVAPWLSVVGMASAYSLIFTVLATELKRRI